MAWGIKKTEHAGAKKGTGAFYGRKAAPSAAVTTVAARTARLPSTLKLLQSLKDPQQKS